MQAASGLAVNLLLSQQDGIFGEDKSMCPLAELEYHQIQYLCHALAVPPPMDAHQSIDAAKECTSTISLPMFTGAVACASLLVLVTMVVLWNAVEELRGLEGPSPHILHPAKSKPDVAQTDEYIDEVDRLTWPAPGSKPAAPVCPVSVRSSPVWSSCDRSSDTTTTAETPPVDDRGMSQDLCSDGSMDEEEEQGEEEAGDEDVPVDLPAAEQPVFTVSVRSSPFCSSCGSTAGITTTPEIRPADDRTTCQDHYLDGSMGEEEETGGEERVEQEEEAVPVSFPTTEQPIRKCRGPPAVANLQVYTVSASARRIRAVGDGFVTPGVVVGANGVRRQVMLKEAPLVGPDAATRQEQLKNEIFILLDIPPHPNIVRILGFRVGGSDQDYLVTERLLCSLHEMLHNNPEGVTVPAMLDYGTVLRIATGIVDGLLHLHRHEIFHGDLKPANILLDEQFHPKLCDFGSSGYCTLWWKGRAQTAFYTAPECEGACCDDRPGKADVYSLGVVLWECVQKAWPMPPDRFVGHEGTDCEGCEGSAESKFDFSNLHPLHDSVPPALRELIRGCLEIEPDRRPSLEYIGTKLHGMMPGEGGL